MAKAQRTRQLMVFLAAAALMLVVLRLIKFVFAAHKASPGTSREQRAATPFEPRAETSTPRTRKSATKKAVVENHHSRARRRDLAPTRPVRRRSLIGLHRLLLVAEIGAIFLLVATGAALWHTRVKLNDVYRDLQQTDPRLLPTLVAAANPGAVSNAIEQSSLPPVGWPAPPLPTPYPTTVAEPAPLATPPAIDGDLQQVAAVEPKSVDTDTTVMLDQQFSSGWSTTMSVQKRLAESGRPRRLRIPAIDVDSFIFQDYGEDWLKLGVVQIGQAVAPGQPGNLVLAGHNDIYGEVFRYLDRLQPGDDLIVAGDNVDYIYHVRETLIVEPDDMWVTLPTSTPTITLVSCYPYLLGTQRIVVFGDLLAQTPGRNASSRLTVQ